jgi:hypothetical protein
MFSPAEMSAIADTALQSLAQLMGTAKPDGCVMEVLGALAMLVSDKSAWSAAPGYHARKDPALTISYRWLSLRHTAADVEAFFSQKCTCPEEMSNRETHDFGASIMNGATETPGQILLTICTYALCDVYRDAMDFTEVKLHLLGKRTAWPYNTTQLLPHGPEDTVCGYLDWLVSDNAWCVDRIMECLGTTVDHTWPMVIPIMVKKRLVIQQFVDLTARWSDTWSRHCITHGERHTFDMVYSYHIPGILMRLLAIIRTVYSECSDATAAAYFLETRWNDVLLSCDRIVTTLNLAVAYFESELTKSMSISALQHAIVVVDIIFAYIPESRVQCSQLLSTELTQALVNAPRHLPQYLPWNTLMSVLHYQYTRQTCSASDCTSTTEQYGRPFRCCTGCWWVQYCSRKCQKNSWRRNDGLQHRDVCSLIRFLRSRLRIPRPNEDLSDAKSITPDYVKQDELVVMETINRHFSALTMHEICR